MTYGLADHMKGYDEKTFICPVCGLKFALIKEKWQHWPERMFCSSWCKNYEILYREFKPLREWEGK